MTLFQFIPQPNQVFSFNPTLDGQTYTAFVPWSLFGVRWYLDLFAPDGNLTFSKALVASPPSRVIESLSWANGYAIATLREPHGYRITDTIQLNIAGCTPAVYNGKVMALVVKEDQIAWPLQLNPGPASQLGVVTYDIDLVAGYVASSTMVFREGTQQFEVNP